MKKMLLSIVCALMVFAVGSFAVAMDQCEVAGNSYTVSIDEIDYTLVFVEAGPMFSPAPLCGGTVILNGFFIYNWSVTHSGLVVAGFKSVLSGGGLTVYSIPSNMYRLRIGDTVYMTEGAIPSLLFK